MYVTITDYRYMAIAKRSGMYNITEDAIIAHANSATIAHLEGMRRGGKKHAPQRDVMKRRHNEIGQLNALFGEYDDGASAYEKSKGLAVPYTTNIINGYTPPPARKRD
jgi:hypothetical protein